MLIGWIVAKILSKIITKLFSNRKLKAWSEKISSDKIVGEDVNIDAGKIVAKFFYWGVLLVFMISATETLGWEVVSKEVGNLLRYLPSLFSALLIFIIGVYIANFIRHTIYTALVSLGVLGSKLISKIIFYIILIILSVMAMNQAGVDTTIITNNITLILGSVLFSFALAFGIGSRVIVQNMLFSLYSKRIYNIGDKIRLGNVEGSIQSIESTNIVIKTAEGRVVLPSKELVNRKVEIID